MPSRNVIRVDIADSFYHVYARGVSQQAIFLDDKDHKVFLTMFKRHLSNEPAKDKTGRIYHHFKGEVDLLAFCLMPNHFHLMFYQYQEGSIARLMQGVMSGYSRYFNKKYQRSGPLFESRYKAAHISNELHLMHISRYIHLNPKQWRTWQWSSLPYYRDELHAEWVDPTMVLEMFSSQAAYIDYVADYEESKETLDSIKHELADQ